MTDETKRPVRREERNRIWVVLYAVIFAIITYLAFFTPLFNGW